MVERRFLLFGGGIALRVFFLKTGDLMLTCRARLDSAKMKLIVKRVLEPLILVSVASR